MTKLRALMTPGLLAAVAALAFCGRAAACTELPEQAAPDPPIQLWVINHGDQNNNGLCEVWIGVELADVFPPGVTTNCVCGFSTSAPLPPSAVVLDAMVTRTNLLTHESIVLPEFDPLELNPVTGIGLAAGPAPIPGQSWVGFSGDIEPFTRPVLGQGEVFKLWFEIEVDCDDFEALCMVFGRSQVAAGTGNNGVPNFSGEHPVVYVRTTPEPSAFVLIGLGAVGLGMQSWRRRRRSA